MTQRNAASDDMFEKARAAFFGTAKISPQEGDKSAKSFEPQRKLTPELVGAQAQTTTK